jgi:RimJ/RimL family protein N-acetyltransferase
MGSEARADMAVVRPRRVVLPGGEEIVIRNGLPDDAPGVLAHRVHMAHSSPHNVVQLDEVEQDLEKEREWLRERAERGYDLFIIATSDAAPGLVIGALHFHSFKWRILSHHGDFGISVDESWRGRGVGTAMVNVLLDWARRHPTIEKVCLGVYEDNAGAIRLYERLGFRLEGRREKFFKTDRGYRDDLMMSLWVKEPGSSRG